MANTVPVPVVTGNPLLDCGDELYREVDHVGGVVAAIQQICEVIDRGEAKEDALDTDAIWRGLGFIAKDLHDHVKRIDDLHKVLYDTIRKGGA